MDSWTYKSEVAIFPDMKRHQWVRPVALPENECHEEEEAHDKHGDNMC